MPVVVQICQEANRHSMIENRSWDGAVILGPAILAPLENVQFTNSAFDAPEDALFLLFPRSGRVVGVIGLQNVTFHDCQFQNVGLAGTPESIEKMKQGFVNRDQESPPTPGD